MLSSHSFDSKYIITALNNNIDRFKSFFFEVQKSEYLWKPAQDKWCLLEIVCHLIDEERNDFKARLKHVLNTPDLPMPEIDPVSWVTKHDYINQNYSEMVNLFLAERKQSVKWLNELESPNYKNAYLHPKFGALTGKMFLTNWLAHDYLHFRQITKLKYDYLKFITGQDIRYAGDW